MRLVGRRGHFVNRHDIFLFYGNVTIGFRQFASIPFFQTTIGVVTMEYGKYSVFNVAQDPELGLSLYFDPRALYSIKETGAKNNSVPTITTDVAIAPVDTGLTPPKVIAAEQNGRNRITIRGTSNPKAVLAVYLTKEQSAKSQPAVHMYADWADKNGHWEITEDENVYLLPPGNYIASAIEYNETSRTKSTLSNGIPFTLREPYLNQFLRRFDTVLNIAVGLFIIVGVAGIILML